VAAEPEADVAPVRPAAAPRESVTIPADARGFYQVLAQVNGVPVRAVVDTGASAIYLGRAQAVVLVGASFLARVHLEQHGNRLTLIPTK
jgi:predicted aspartyl protease